VFYVAKSMKKQSPTPMKVVI